MPASADSTPLTLELDAFTSLTIAFVVFFLGLFLTRRIEFLKKYNIPEPVSGGFAVAILTWLLYSVFQLQIEFDLGARDDLLVLFFATIGLNARFSDLMKGGKLLIWMLLLTVAFMFVQNGVALAGTSLFGLPSAVCVLLGTASLIGGHGTAIAWGPTIAEDTGFAAAAEVGIATATLGLIFAALMGGPIAKFLIDRYKLTPDKPGGDPMIGESYEKKEESATSSGEDGINYINLMQALLATHVSVILGKVGQEILLSLGLQLPLFVPTMLVAILLSNSIPYLVPQIPWPARSRSMALISDYTLSVFLAMSLMSMQLWGLAELGLPLVVILALQVIASAAFVIFVFFFAMGKDYTAAVLSAGFAGFTLGATPTAIANMSSVTKQYGPAPLAFIVLPLVSAFFVDLANAIIIKLFVSF
ncbi:MAG: sodium/glutamate symporter [Verrucomicrobiota bacterium]